MTTSFDRSEIDRKQETAVRAVRALQETVTDMLPAGTLVDYNYGGRWTGPCTVIGVNQFCSNYYGPSISVKNLKSGKIRHICSVGYIRLHAGPGGAA